MRHFLNVVAAGLLSVSLGGCDFATISESVKAASGFAVTQDQLDAARESYVALLHPAAYYAGLRRCKAGEAFFPNNCHDAATLKRLQGAKNAIRDGLSTVQADIDAGNNSGAVAAFNTVKTAITTGQGIVTSLGLK